MRLLLYFVAAVVIAGVVGIFLFPLSLALSLVDAPIEGDPEGTIWQGRIENAAIEGVRLGEVQLSISPLPLLTGRLAGHVAIDGPAGTGQGRFSLTSDRISLTQAEGTVRLDALPLVDPLGRQVTGSVEVEAEDLMVTREACLSGAIALKTDAFARAVQSFGAEGFPLAGQGVCEDGTLFLPMKGSGAEGEAVLTLMGSPRRFVSELTVRPANPALGSALTQHGFQRTPDGYTLTTRGRI
jgi:hypothetical protein